MKKMHVGQMAMTLLVTFTWVLTASAASADIRETIERSFTVAPGGWLHLETDKGTIEVRTSPEPEVDVRVDLRADTASERKARDILETFRCL